MLKITTFGEFSISDGSQTLTEQNKRSRKMWTLLQYIIAHHNKEISQNELIELLWPEGESDNPSGALKTQMHRLRTVLEKLDTEKEIIISTLGAYAFNNKIPHEADFELFEEYMRNSAEDIPDSERLEYLLKAVSLYKGDFLHKSALDSWVMPLNAYFHARYLKAVHEANNLLYKADRKQEIVDICRRAVIIDPMDEALHCRLIRTLTELGDAKSAADQYSYVTSLYLDQGITPSDELTSLYGRTFAEKDKSISSISDVRKSLDENEVPEGAFFCEFEFFKHVYRLEMREAERSSAPVHLCLLTITGADGHIPDIKTLKKACDKLTASISVSLRTSDVYTRSSAAQFALLLPNTTEQTCQMIIDRILKKFKHDSPRLNVKITSENELLQAKGF